MKKMIMFCLAVLTAGLYAQDLKLTAPQTKGGASLREALTKRCTVRSYSGKKLSDQQLSDLFYAACGINRKNEKKLTIPSARNVQDLVVYAATSEGIYRYDAEKHLLKLLKKGDYRTQFGLQKEMFSKAAVVLIFTSDLSRFNFNMPKNEIMVYAGVHAGFAIQNVGLFCAAEKLGNVVIGSYDRKKTPELLGLKKNQPVLMLQIVGIPK